MLDYQLENSNGHEVLAALNNNPQRPPVIIVSGNVSQKMAVGFLNLQVFGFLEKPVALSELIDKLDMATVIKAPNEVLKDRHIELDVRKRVARFNDESVSLTETQTQIVCFFLSNRGIVITREQLITHLWGNSHVSRNALDTHLLNIKNKLPPFRSNLQLIHGRGYFYAD